MAENRDRMTDWTLEQRTEDGVTVRVLREKGRRTRKGVSRLTREFSLLNQELLEEAERNPRKARQARMLTPFYQGYLRAGHPGELFRQAWSCPALREWIARPL